MKYSSMAGTSEVYHGNEMIRVRKLGETQLRIHIPRKFLRERENYVAIDLSCDALVRAIIDSQEG